ncbi:hypothetical protein EC988_007875, partial [Linderina pennispora]
GTIEDDPDFQAFLNPKSTEELAAEAAKQVPPKVSYADAAKVKGAATGDDVTPLVRYLRALKGFSGSRVSRSSSDRAKTAGRAGGAMAASGSSTPKRSRRRNR